jgi:hypothetical protein
MVAAALGVMGLLEQRAMEARLVVTRRQVVAVVVPMALGVVIMAEQAALASSSSVTPLIQQLQA